MMIGKRKLSSRLLALIIAIAMAACLIPVNMWEVGATTTLRNPTIANGVTTWDCVYFGSYPQSSDGSGGFLTEPIKWRVLSVDGNDAFLLADKNLDCKPYNAENVDVTWETCTLRSWLNDDFINTAFTAAEQSAIKTATVVNDDNPDYWTEGGNNTQDKVYLLSIGEAIDSAYGFNNELHEYDEARHAKNTAYAEESGVLINPDDGNGMWWLRSPGGISFCAAYVYYFGYVYFYGTHVDHYSGAVRPALHLNLSSDVWNYAGTVASDGTVNEGEPPVEPTPSTKAAQAITASDKYYITFGSKPFSLGATAKTKLAYKSSNINIAAVSSDGIVTLKNPGKAKITITAAETEQYKRASKIATLNVKLKQPTLKVRVSGSKEVTLTWNKVTGATKYEVYMYDTKKKKFVKKITKKASQRSAVHKDMTKGKNYQYKVRAYRVVDGKKVYSAFSNVKKVKVK